MLKSHVKVTHAKMLESNATHIPKKNKNFGQQNMNEICELVNLIAIFFFFLSFLHGVSPLFLLIYFCISKIFLKNFKFIYIFFALN